MATDSPDFLDLDALIGPTVLLNGKVYEMVNPPALPPLRARKLARLGKRNDELLSKEQDLTPEEEAELGTMHHRMAALILLAPEDVISGLTDIQASKVADCFFGELLTLNRQELKRFRLVLSTGANGSPGSAPSTEATP